VVQLKDPQAIQAGAPAAAVKTPAAGEPWVAASSRLVWSAGESADLARLKQLSGFI